MNFPLDYLVRIHNEAKGEVMKSHRALAEKCWDIARANAICSCGGETSEDGHTASCTRRLLAEQLERETGV